MTYCAPTEAHEQPPSRVDTWPFTRPSKSLRQSGAVESLPLNSQVAAVSVGIVNGVEMLDLTYPEDSSADVDLNIVMTGDYRYVEVQGTAEQEPFDGRQLDRLLELGRKGVAVLLEAQRAALGTKE